MRSAAIAYAVTFVVFLALDATWLGLVAKDFYQSQIGPLMLAKPNFGAAALFYPLYFVGVVVFVVLPALADGSWLRALGYGAFFGIIAYGTYDLTNLATLRGWTVTMVLADMAWGAVATAIAAALATAATVRFA